ncbi:IMP cyclohydrolase [bacterium]|nr:IMP cyclohydrolase [bacterium]MDD5918447.1 IMP cyclohydrolase [bacterium]
MQTQNIATILKENGYVGRGVLMGRSPSGKKAAMAYFIMGRSENSQNRVFIEKGEELIIHPFDESKVEDPSLIIYAPVRVSGANTIVTNGDQTDTIYDFLAAGKSFEAALRTRCFEPDAPNFTSRISGMMTLSDSGCAYKLSILKSADAAGSACLRQTFEYAEPLPGVGHFIHTYQTDGNPLPAFAGEPEQVALPETAEELADLLWNNLDARYKISLFVRYIDIETGAVETRVVNRHQK